MEKERALIRPATPEDAQAAARFIAMAEGEMVRLLTGLDDQGAAEKKLALWAASATPNRYSHDNTLVAEAEGGAVGALISFPADRQHALDALILEDLRRRGRDLERLFAEGIPGTYYLSTMGIDPAFRGRGIGGALIAAAERRGKELGFAGCSLLVSSDKPRAKSLYERLGFRAFDRVNVAGFEYCRMIHE